MNGDQLELHLLLLEEEKELKNGTVLPLIDGEAYQKEDEAGCFAPCAIQNGREARALSAYILDDHGHIDEKKLGTAVSYLEKHLFFFGTGAEELLRRRKKLLSSLRFLAKEPTARQLIHRLGRPTGNLIAERAIRQTLLLDEGANISEVETRKAVLVALFGTLRQSLGSCFATAPAILVHEHQPMVFLENIEELFSTSRLKKVVAGLEMVVPQNMGWGEGDLKKQVRLSLKKEENSFPFWRSPTLLKGLFDTGLLSTLPSTDHQAFNLFTPAIGLIRNPGGFTPIKDLLLAFILQQNGLSLAAYEQYLLKKQQPLLHQELETHTKSTVQEQTKRYLRVEEAHDKLMSYLTAHTDIALLKMWEYTIASFAEVKLGMCRNNFYISLGVNWNDEGGIGSVLYQAAKQKVDEANQLVEESQREFDMLNTEMALLNQRLQTASTEQEMQWLKVEHQTRQVEQYNLKQRCEIAVDRANKIANLHELLLEKYDGLLKEYFQEIYDPDLHEVETGPYDDSPAGFRLLYKHGRSNSALWTLIRSLDEWRDALASFFSITEQELLLLPELSNVENEVRHIISRLVQHIRSDEFVETALQRYARAYNAPCPEAPLQHLDQVEKKPWVYTSGGSMSSLVEAYFALEQPPEEHARWVENETELFAYIIDTVRMVQKRTQGPLPEKMLMHSPTHAFLLLPHHPSFQESWQSGAYSYTWIKQTLEEPSRSFYSSYAFSQETTEAINETIAQFLDPKEWRHIMKDLSVVSNFLRSFEYAKEVQHIVEIEAPLRKYSERLRYFDWDQFFFSNLPYIGTEQLVPLLTQVIQKVTPHKNSPAILSNIHLKKRTYSKQSWLLLLKTALISCCKQGSCHKNHLDEALSLLPTMIDMPSRAVLFADTNWMKEYFAFAISPTTLSLKLWTCSELATTGAPVTAWTPWLNGSRKDRTWGIFVNPDQYNMKQTFSIFKPQQKGLTYFR